MASRPVAILVVDDDSGDVELIRRAFRKAGFENALYVVDNGQDAVRYLHGEGRYADRSRFPVPGLVILDNKLPRADGWEVLKRMGRKASQQSPTVVVFSGSDNPAHKRLALESGASAYYMKPPRSEEFTLIVKEIGESWLPRGDDGQ